MTDNRLREALDNITSPKFVNLVVSLILHQ